MTTLNKSVAPEMGRSGYLYDQAAIGYIEEALVRPACFSTNLPPVSLLGFLFAPSFQSSRKSQPPEFSVKQQNKLSLMALLLTTLFLAISTSARGITEAPSAITPAPEAACPLTNSIPNCGVSPKRAKFLSGTFECLEC